MQHKKRLSAIQKGLLIASLVVIVFGFIVGGLNGFPTVANATSMPLPEYILPMFTVGERHPVAPGPIHLPLPIIKPQPHFANLSVVYSSLTYTGNTVNFTIVVKNNGNAPVRLYAIRLSGKWAINFSMQAVNVPPVGVSMQHQSKNGVIIANMAVVFFVVNGSLKPFPNAKITPILPQQNESFGITILPGQEKTLSFYGEITIPYAGQVWLPTAKAYITPLNGNIYKIKLISAPATLNIYHVKAKEI